MPWKDRYTISDEKSLLDSEIRWPEGQRCCFRVVVDLSPPCGPDGIAAGDVANRLTAIAGPKVFTSRHRRFSSLCFGTVKVPQSADVSSGEAVLSPREVARAARRAIEVAHERLALGDVLLLFPEGTRSRTQSMQGLLPAAARYLEGPETWVVPAGLAGPESLFAIEDSILRPARVVIQLGRPIRAQRLMTQAAGDRRVTMDAIGLAIAELVPPSYGGVYANAGDHTDAAIALRASRSERQG